MSALPHHKPLRSRISALRQELLAQGFDAGASSIAEITVTSIAFLQHPSLLRKLQ